MSLLLLPTRKAMIPTLQVYFNGTGGTEPYIYTVLAGGAGGTIDASSGLYTGPSGYNLDPKKNIDTIQVEDFLGAKSTAKAYILTPLQLFCDVIQQEMGLADGRVYLWDQKINSPTDMALWVSIRILSCKPFSNSNKFDPALGQVQSVNMHAQLSCDIFSRNTEARDRKEEIIMALNSYYSESQQEMNSFKIFPLSSSFLDLSQIDGSAIPYRFNITCSIQYFMRKFKQAPYFDDFSDVEVTADP